MTRVPLFVLLSSLIPAVAGAQIAPPAPPAPVAPLPAPAPTPPTPPAPPVAPLFVMPGDFAPLAPLAVENAIAAARPFLALDRDAIREQAQAARADAEAGRVEARAATAAARGAVWDMAPMQDNEFMVMRPGTGDADYNSGLTLLTRHDYDQAIVRFDRVVAARGAHADGALYYKAWALSKLGKSDDANTTLADLRKNYPSSHYLNDARALEADVKKLGPGQVDDDDLKLLAIQGMHSADPERAVPLLENVLNATNSLAVKKNALYVMATIDRPEAHQAILSYAKGKGNPDLQRTAIQYLGSRGSKTTSAELIDIYNSNPDVDVRMAVIGAFRSAGDKNSLVRIASGNGFGGPATAPMARGVGQGVGVGRGGAVSINSGDGQVVSMAERSRAINGLSDLASPQELWPLYQKEDNKDLRSEWVSTFASMDAVDQLMQIVKTEKDPGVRQKAIRSLGNLKSEKTGQTLVDLYGSDTDKATKQAVIQALGNQNNADALVAIARKETDRDLKVDIVRRLVDISPRSKAASDYLMEIIK